MEDIWTTYWFMIDDEESDLSGEEFLTELKNGTKEQHINYAHELFPNVNIMCYGKISPFEAEVMGLDTY